VTRGTEMAGQSALAQAVMPDSAIDVPEFGRAALGPSAAPSV